MKIDVVVCGRFHYHRYWNMLGDSLGKVVYSYKFHDIAAPPKKNSLNLFIKEYLVGAHLRFFGRRLIEYFMPIYHFVWKIQAFLSYKSTSDVALVMLHGNCLSIIKNLRECGVKIIGEAVNQHPSVLLEVLSAEAKLLGLKEYNPGFQYNEALAEIELIDCLLVPSRSVANSYVKQGFPVDKIKLLPYPLNLSMKNDNNKSTIHSYSNSSVPRYKVLAVGQICLRKGQARLLEALSLLILEGWEFEITFVGTADHDYLALLKQKKIEFNHIEHIPNNSLLEVMRQQDLVVLSSIEDGFGISAIEAIGVGCQVVVSKYAGVSDFVEKYPDCGVVVDPLDTVSFAKSIKQRIKIKNSLPFLVESEMGTWIDYAIDVRKISENLVKN